MMVSES